jgi:hypothetical protein
MEGKFNIPDEIYNIKSHYIPECNLYSIRKFIDTSAPNGIKILNDYNILGTLSEFSYKSCIYPIYEYLIKSGIDINNGYNNGYNNDYNNERTAISDVINKLIGIHNRRGVHDRILNEEKIINLLNVIKLLVRSGADINKVCFKDVEINEHWNFETRYINEMLVLTSLVYQDTELLNLIISKIKPKRSKSKILVSGLVMWFVYLSSYSQLHYRNYECQEDYKTQYYDTPHFIYKSIQILDIVFNNINPDIKFNGTYPLLFLTVDHELLGITELLITRYRSDINAKSNVNIIGNIYPLERAMVDGNLPMINILLQNGAKVNDVIINNFFRKLQIGFELDGNVTIYEHYFIIKTIIESILIYSIDGKYRPEFYDHMLEKWNLVNNYPQIHEDVSTIIKKHKRINDFLKKLSSAKITHFVNEYVKEYIYRPPNQNNGDPGSGIFHLLNAKHPTLGKISRKRKLSVFGKRK